MQFSKILHKYFSILNIRAAKKSQRLTIFTREDVKEHHQRLHKMAAVLMNLNGTNGLFQTGQDHLASGFTAARCSTSHYQALHACFGAFQELKSAALSLENINTLYLKETVLCICQHFPFSLAA